MHKKFPKHYCQLIEDVIFLQNSPKFAQTLVINIATDIREEGNN